MEKLINEKWKDVKNHEGLYQVSSYGNVKSLGRLRNNQWGITKRFTSESIISTQLSKDGYPTLKLSVNGISKRFRVHRLVAEAFIPNPKNKPQVNHINGIKTDNRVENLEWCTQAENQLHASEMGLRKTKLSKDDIIMIRKDNRTLDTISKDFNISFQTVSEIKNRKIWGWVK